jgi:hypothetical protein
MQKDIGKEGPLYIPSIRLLSKKLRLRSDRALSCRLFGLRAGKVA